jgi:hypothetical protein
VNIHNGFNFDVKVMATAAALEYPITGTFEKRRLGNVGDGVFWRLMNGSMIVDSMYTASRDASETWKSLSLARMCATFDLPPKLDASTMKIPIIDDIDITDVVVYNARDADLHVWLAKRMLMCERMCMIAGMGRTTLWESVANNTDVMGFCLEQSVALSMYMMIDLGRNTRATDERKFQGGT